MLFKNEEASLRLDIVNYEFPADGGDPTSDDRNWLVLRCGWKDEDGNVVLGSEITKKKAILMWLEQGKEPTEHILNEMLEQEEDYQNISADIIFIIKDKSALENAKLKLVLNTFKKIKVYYDSFVPNVETLARRMYVDPDKLPLIIVTTKELNAVYACSGYNVGSGDMLVKICTHF